MVNENLEKLVQHARDKKPTDFKTVLTSEIDSRIGARVSEIRDGLSKNMFKENCEGHPDGVEHTHDDGTVHTHPGGDKEHTHDEEVEEGTLPPALQKAIDAKKKKGGDDEEDKEKDEGTLPPALQKAIDAKKKGKGDDDEDEDKEQDENIANFGDKRAKPFTDDDNPTDNKKKKDKKSENEDIRAVAKRILRGK